MDRKFTKLENNCIEIHVQASGTPLEEYGVELHAGVAGVYDVHTPMGVFDSLECTLSELQSLIEESEEDYSDLDQEVQETLDLLSEIKEEKKVFDQENAETDYFNMVWELSTLEPEAFYKMVSTFVRQNPDKDFDSFVKSKIS